MHEAYLLNNLKGTGFLTFSKSTDHIIQCSYSVVFNSEQTSSHGLTNMCKAFRSPLKVNGYCDKY